MNNEFNSFYILFDEDKKKAKEIRDNFWLEVCKEAHTTNRKTIEYVRRRISRKYVIICIKAGFSWNQARYILK